MVWAGFSLDVKLFPGLVIQYKKCMHNIKNISYHYKKNCDILKQVYTM